MRRHTGCSSSPRWHCPAPRRRAARQRAARSRPLSAGARASARRAAPRLPAGAGSRLGQPAQLAGGGRAQQAQPFAARSALNPIGLHRASWRGAHRAPDVHVLDGLHARNLRAARRAQHGAGACQIAAHCAPGACVPELARTRRRHMRSAALQAAARPQPTMRAGGVEQRRPLVAPLCATPERASQAGSVAGARAGCVSRARMHAGCVSRACMHTDCVSRARMHAGGATGARGARAGAHVQQHKADVVGVAVPAGHADDDVAGRVAGHLRRSTSVRRHVRTDVQSARHLHPCLPPSLIRAPCTPPVLHCAGRTAKHAAPLLGAPKAARTRPIAVHTGAPLSAQHQQHQRPCHSTRDQPGAPQQGG